ncbi:MAG: hypothetical protein HQ594_07010 [Candidatus Omnitrophica bacterium]|nr:hypothetical protein [Candidatus Omnitrophota bacterium]
MEKYDDEGKSVMQETETDPGKTSSKAADETISTADSTSNSSGQKQREEELESEIRSFEKERENVRRIIGRIGGMPSTKSRVINIIFITLVLAVFTMSIMWGGRVRFFMIEVGILLLSLKLVYFLESHMRLNHFQFWILSSLEWRMDKIEKKLTKLLKRPREGE